MAKTPISVRIVNQDDEPFFFLLDNQPQSLTVVIQNISEQPITLGDRSNSSTFDFQLLLRPGILLRAASLALDLVQVEDKSDTGWSMTFVESSAFPLPRFATVTFSRAGSNQLVPGERLRLHLKNVHPDSVQGARPVRMELKFDVGFGSTPSRLQGTAVTQVNLLNTSPSALQQAPGRHAITSVTAGPVKAEFVGSNWLVCDGAVSNQFIIRVTPNPLLTANSTVRVTSDCKLTLDCDFDPGKSLTVAATAQHAVWAGGREVGTAAETWDVSQPLDFTVTGVISASAGYSPVTLTWRNFPDFPDGQLVLLAQLGAFLTHERKDNAGQIASVDTAVPLQIWNPGGIAFVNGTLKKDSTASATPAATLSLDTNGLFTVNATSGVHVAGSLVAQSTIQGDTITATSALKGASAAIDGQLTVGNIVSNSIVSNGSVEAAGANAQFFFRQCSTEPAFGDVGDYSWYSFQGAARLGTSGHSTLLAIGPSGDLFVERLYRGLTRSIKVVVVNIVIQTGGQLLSVEGLQDNSQRTFDKVEFEEVNRFTVKFLPESFRFPNPAFPETSLFTPLAAWCTPIDALPIAAFLDTLFAQVMEDGSVILEWRLRKDRTDGLLRVLLYLLLVAGE